MIREGGDTDTNAAIVGGMMGALAGFQKLPQELKDKIMNFDNYDADGKPNTEQVREQYLLPKYNLSKLLIEIYEKAPETLKI